jgi:signal transduction histidine kinase/DNA-binding response OmpR family regulator
VVTLLTIEVRYEEDLVLTRQRARQIAQLLGFESQDQTRIATATSEVARNAFQYAQGGRVEFQVQSQSPELTIVIRDRGSGIPALQQVLAGQYTSSTGMGLGLVGSRRLMDQFEIESSEQGTIVRMVKFLPRQSTPLTRDQISSLTQELVQRVPQTPIEEIQQQNQELLRALESLRQREEQLTQLNRELEDTNRGVVALYAELDEKADSLRRANDLKTRFLSNMSHEFRTPVNSIISLSRLLIDRLDGDLTPEQEKQVVFIQKAATGLSELVNDLLDLAKVEAGKITVRPAAFEVSELFATLRGMLRPLLAHNSSVNLVFEPPTEIPTLHTDEGKVAQILRNFISNALKFTPQGEVRVKAALSADRVCLSVADTGIGIAAADRDRIFEDFIQIESRLQGQVQGTGLGLPLARRLAELLGGQVEVSSQPGVGSTFSATLPLVYSELNEVAPLSSPIWPCDPCRSPVLIVEDNPETLFTYERYLARSCYQPIAARTVLAAKQALEQVRPVVIVLDVLLEQQNTLAFLSELKTSPTTQAIPVLVVTLVENEQQVRVRGAEAFLNKPIDRLALLDQLNRLARSDRQTLLLLDDDPTVRYLLKQYLIGTGLQILEADNGAEGLRLAQTQPLDAIVMDLEMPQLSGLEVLERFKSDPSTRSIPVIIHSSEPPTAEQQLLLSDQVLAILSKSSPQEAAIAPLREALIRAGLVLEPQGGRDA